MSAWEIELAVCIICIIQLSRLVRDNSSCISPLIISPNIGTINSSILQILRLYVAKFRTWFAHPDNRLLKIS